MSLADEMSRLFRRDLTRAIQQLQAFPDDRSVRQRVGTMNSAGNLILHLEGNLREYIGRQLGDVEYHRDRPAEFSETGIPVSGLISRMEDVREIATTVLARLSAERLSSKYPEDVFGLPLTTQMFLIHLHGHFNYHLGQIDTIRRALTGGSAINYAGL